MGLGDMVGPLFQYGPQMMGLGLQAADMGMTSFNQFLAQMMNAKKTDEANNLTNAVSGMQTDAATSLARDFSNRYGNLPNLTTGQYDAHLGGMPGAYERRGNQIYNTALGDSQRIMGDLRGREDALMGDARANYGNIMGQYDQRIGSLMGEATGERDRIMQMFEGRGDQERKDIGQQYKNLMGQTEQDVGSRGLAGSTVLPSLRRGVARSERADLARLDERLRGERIGHETDWSRNLTNMRAGLTGERIGADQGMLNQLLGLKQGLSGERINADQGLSAALTNLQTGLSGDTLGANERFNTNRYNQWQGANQQAMQNQERLAFLPLDYEYRGYKDIYNLLSDTKYGGPDQGLFQGRMGAMGAGMAPVPDIPKPSALSYFAPGAGAAAGTFLGAGAYKALAGCIDSEATLETPEGEHVAMNEIGVGTHVRGADQKWHRIAKIIIGAPHDGQADFVQIACIDGRSIVLTMDHVIDGRPAGQWKPGQSLDGSTIDSVKLVAPREAGDVMLEDGVDALVNSFPVASMYRLKVG